jgi:hypothetical protein
VKPPDLFISRPAGWLMVFMTTFLVIGRPGAIVGHPMPNSVVLLDVHANRIDADIQIPLVELQAAPNYERILKNISAPKARTGLYGRFRLVD